MTQFGCDYLSGCHPAILDALVATNLEQTAGYGLDPYCEAARARIRAAVGSEAADVHSSSAVRKPTPPLSPASCVRGRASSPPTAVILPCTKPVRLKRAATKC